MKSYIFSIVTNIIAAFALFRAGATEMNNLGTSIPALFCVIAVISSIIQVLKSKGNK